MEALTGLGTAANVIAVVDLAACTTSALAVYVRGATQSSSVRSLLAQEALLLQDLLQRLLNRVTTSAHDTAWLASHQAALSQLQQAHEDLVKLLKIDIAVGTPKKEDRLHSFLTAAKWPFSKTDVYSILERVSRLQRYVNAILRADQAIALERLSIQHAEVEYQGRDYSMALSTQNARGAACCSLCRSERFNRMVFAEREVRHWKNGARAHSLLWCSGIPVLGKLLSHSS